MDRYNDDTILSVGHRFLSNGLCICPGRNIFPFCMVSEQQPLIFSNTNTDFQYFLIGGPKGNEQYSYMFTTHSFIACLGKKPTTIKNIFIKTASHYKSLGFSRKIISYPDSVSIAGRQFKLGRQFPIFHTNLKRSNFSTRGLYYSPCFTVFLQCQHGTAFIPCSSAPIPVEVPCML